MRTWARHIQSGDPRFHAIAAVVYGGSVITRCRGRWPEQDAVEECENPAAIDRCDCCEQALVDAGMVMRGLRELHERFDVGGVE